MEAPKGCPFASRLAGSGSAPMDTSGCPFAGSTAASSSRPTQQQAADAATAASGDASPAAPAAVCPLGFGTSRGPKLSTLHCPVCKALLFEAHRITSCKHTFCKSCISQTRDCPSCGRDVDGLEPNTELAGLVDTFLDTHSQSPQLVAAQADLGPLPDNSAASFYLAQGLKSLAGGNIHAALHRLGKAKQALLDTPTTAEGSAGTSIPADPHSQGIAATASSAGSQQHLQQQPHAAAAESAVPDAVARAVQLATICGCLGDCYQRLGEREQARRQYSESVAAVQPHSEEHAEAAHAMSVSLNKLGDASYLSQDLPAAKALYAQALQLRQLCCGPLTSGQAGPQEQLELAASCIKLADVCKAMGDSDEAERHLRRAHGVCCEVQVLESSAALAPHVSRKLQLLMGVLQAQGQHVGVQDAAAGPAAAAAAGPSGV